MTISDKLNSAFFKALPHSIELSLRQRLIAQRDKRSAKSIRQAVEFLESRWPSEDVEQAESPIFLFSAGWRSGSTLLQRLVMSDENILLWGEPYASFNIITGQARSLAAISESYPPKDWIIDSHQVDRFDKSELPEKFIANLYPNIDSLREAHKSFISRLFQTPAIENGYRRWGLKEVRWGSDVAFYLKWLFPNAKFLFLYRDPYKAYASIKPKLHRWLLYETWPSKPIRTPYRFGSHWAELTSGYLADHESLGALLIKYEDLCSGTFPLDRLDDYLGARLNRSLLNQKVGSTKNKRKLTWSERYYLNKSVEPIAKQLGYAKP